MHRRDFVKSIVAASVSAKTMLGQQATANPVAPSTPPPNPAAPGPVPWMRGLMDLKPLPTPLTPDAVAQTNTHFFTDSQSATLRRLCELMMPSYKGYPGAIEAGAPEFLEFLISISPSERQQLYQSGLDRLDAEAKQHFHIAFANADKQHADELIRPWLQTWMSDHPPKEPYARFINIVHSDIRTATVNSEAWSNAAEASGKQDPDTGLYWFPIDPEMRLEAAAPVCQTNQKKRRS